MPKELLLLSEGERPASVFFRGGIVRIDVHDEWHERTLKRLKADIVALHPDKALSGFRRRRNSRRQVAKAIAFEYAQRNLKRWMSEEVQWYAAFGLKPLRVTGMAQVTTFLYTRLDDHRASYYIPPSTTLRQPYLRISRRAPRTQQSNMSGMNCA